MHTLKKIILTSLLVVGFSLTASADNKKSNYSSSARIFTSIIKELENSYVDSIDIKSVVNDGIELMLYKLDPYTTYFDAEAEREFMDQNKGEYAGIGSYIMARDGYVWISGPNPGSPAAKAGLRIGDKILRIDGEDMKGKTTEQVSNKLRGAIGTKVNIDVARQWTPDSLLSVVVERDKIQMPAVPWYGVISGDLGYIQLTQYSEKSDEEVRTALLDLINNHKIKGLIFDLRGNGGGYLQSAVRILSYFLPKGTEVLRTRGRDRLDESIYKTSTKPIAESLPLVVLTDESTASASEITAGALQDLDRAVILGERTYGKGLVQSTFGISEGGLLKITTAKYYIPSGRLIQAIDYRHRAADGSATRIADSLTNKFTTAAGRTVRDGGGITPDVAMSYPEPNHLTYKIVADNWSWDFANKYFAENPQAPDIDNIEITDTIYARFKNFLDPERFSYDKMYESALDKLKEVATREGYMTPEIDEQFTKLSNMMKHSLTEDLDIHRDAIAPYLERQIAERYYATPGAIKSALRHDEMVEEATKILHDPARYKSILAPQPEK